MKDYHYAWLSDHPERSEEWLRDRLREGFHVHHLNGDHDDNHPENLVLLEGSDHMMLHTGGKRTKLGRMRTPQARLQEKLPYVGPSVFKMRKKGLSWAQIVKETEIPESKVKRDVEQHAKEKGLAVPHVDRGKNICEECGSLFVPGRDADVCKECNAERRRQRRKRSA